MSGHEVIWESDWQEDGTWKPEEKRLDLECIIRNLLKFNSLDVKMSVDGIDHKMNNIIEMLSILVPMLVDRGIIPSEQIAHIIAELDNEVDSEDLKVVPTGQESQ